MNDNNIDNEENHPEQEQTAASNDRASASATTAKINKQGFKRAPEDVLKGRKIYKINRTAFQSKKTPAAAAAASVTGTSVAAATTNGTTTPSSSTTTTTDNKNDDTTIKTDDDNDKKSATTAGPSTTTTTTTTTNSNPFAATREDDEDDEDDEDADHEEHDINSNSDSDSDDEQSLSEDDKRKARSRLIACLEGYNTFTLQTRKEIDELVWTFEELLEFDDNDYLTEQEAILELISLIHRYGELTEQERNTTDQLVGNFLEKLEDDIIGQFCKYDADDNRALDSDRDTKAQVEAIVRVFPEVLTRKKPIGPEDYYPIQLLAFARTDDRDWQCNVSRVSFIPLVARLAIEFDLFEEEERGGLLCEDEDGDNVLYLLMLSVSDRMTESQEYYESIDTKYLQVLIQLRRMDLLKKEDIQRYRLLFSCQNLRENKRFRFLVEWDPNALTQTDEHGRLPIYCQACLSCIQDFQSIFKDGIHYFPKKKGINLLFHKDKFGKTPFQKACEKYKPKQVKEIVEDTLICYITSFDNHASPLNIVDALMMAAIEENVHLDSVYTLIRRQPDILPNILSESDADANANANADADADVDATSEVI